MRIIVEVQQVDTGLEGSSFEYLVSVTQEETELSANCQHSCLGKAFREAYTGFLHQLAEELGS